LPTCFIHPWVKHRTSDCQQFLSKTVEERRELVRDHRLCYHCHQRHLARHCPQKTRCEKCQGGHSQLLHLEHKDHVQSCLREQVHQHMANGKLNAINSHLLIDHINKIAPNVDFAESEASVLLIALTALKNGDGDSMIEIPFYALLDTGVDTSICTRELAEELFGWTPNDKISIQFLEKASENYNCMKQTLRLKYGDNRMVTINKWHLSMQGFPTKNVSPIKRYLKNTTYRTSTSPSSKGSAVWI